MENDRFATLKVFWEGDVVEVGVFWRNRSSLGLGVLALPDRHAVLIGAGQVSAVVDLVAAEVRDVEFPFMFWGFERAGQKAVELGEVECMLRDETGKVVARTPVDPPYDYRREGTDLIFRSIVHGETRLDGVYDAA